MLPKSHRATKVGALLAPDGTDSWPSFAAPKRIRPPPRNWKSLSRCNWLRSERLAWKPSGQELERKLGRFFHVLEAANADFEALHKLEQHTDQFTSAELVELRALLGLYGHGIERRLPSSRTTVEYVATRQNQWREVALPSRELARSRVAERGSALWLEFGGTGALGSWPIRMSEHGRAGVTQPRSRGKYHVS